MNQVNLIGKVYGEIHFHKQNNGDYITKFKVLIESWNNKNTVIDCVAWRKNAEIIHDEVRTSDLVSITGRLNTKDLKELVNETKVFEVIVDRINLVLPNYAITQNED